MRIGPYELAGEVGRGGSGVVYRARGPDGRQVALKLLISTSADARARFDRERRLLASLGESQGFVELVDSGDSPHGPWLVMDFVTGGSLRQRLAAGPLGLAAALDLVHDLARAVGEAHARGIVHRDLKPENILFAGDGAPLVADLGIAKHFRSGDATLGLTRSAEMKGTAGYMAPEQLDSARDVGPQADVFSLGAILYECIAGKPAFEGDSIHAVLAKLASCSHVSLSAARSDVPRWVSRVVARALRVDPAARYPDARAFALALETGATSRRAPVALAAVAVVAVAGVAVALLGRRWPDEVAPAAPAVAPVATRAAETPAWFLALPKSDRPPFPLPRGIEVGERTGEYVNAKDGSVLLFVPAGSFVMGYEGPQAQPHERPAHPVELGAYFIGKLEVTNAQFRRFVDATGYRTEAEAHGGGFLRSQSGFGDRMMVPEASWLAPFGKLKDVAAPPDQPVVQLSQPDAEAYCAWAGLRLPTEAEWERAAGWDARAHRARRYPWGDDPPRPGQRLANTCDRSLMALALAIHVEAPELDDGYAATAPVGSFPDGASPIGALDMAGNAREWVGDVYDAGFYARAPRRDPFNRAASNEDNAQRLFRGGSFLTPVWQMRVADRDDTFRSYRGEDTGLRVARDGR